jgi:general secretion pathway protein L
MSTLIITLPLVPARLSNGGAADVGLDYSYAAISGSAVSSHGSAPLSLLPRTGRGYAEVVALVPVQALAWQQVSLPKGALKSAMQGSPRLQAVLGGLLEERVLDDVDKLHFALQPDAQAEQTIWVAVCDKAWLRGHLQTLEAAQWRVARIVPELAPWLAAELGNVPSVHVLGDAAAPLLATCDANGVSLLPLSPASLALALGASASDDSPAVPVLVEPALAAQVEHLLQRKVTLQQAATRALQAAASRWDLAQFELANSNRSRAVKSLSGAVSELLVAPQWRWARWGAALLLLANVVGLNAYAWRESAALDAKRSAARDVLTASFPSVKVVLDAPVQMQREVSRLQQATGAATGRDLESMLTALGSAVGQGQTAVAIEYVADSARLKGLKLTPEDISRLKVQGFAASTEGDVLILKAVDTAGAAP